MGDPLSIAAKSAQGGIDQGNADGKTMRDGAMTRADAGATDAVQAQQIAGNKPMAAPSGNQVASNEPAPGSAPSPSAQGTADGNTNQLLGHILGGGSGEGGEETPA